MLTTFVSNLGCRWHTVRSQEISLSSIFPFPFTYPFFLSSKTKLSLPILYPPQKRAKRGRGWKENRRIKVSGSHFIWAGSQTERTVCSPPASCGFSPWPWCHNSRCMCMCEAKADNITAFHGLLKQMETGITSDYWLTDSVHPQIYKHTHTQQIVLNDSPKHYREDQGKAPLQSMWWQYTSLIAPVSCVILSFSSLLPW